MSGRISLSSIRVFEAAARLGSFKEAADELGMTPTAVSHRIRGLEADLGTALFSRSHRKADLTAAGDELFEASRAAVSVVDAAIERIGASRHSVTLTTTPAFAALWLAPRLQAFQAAVPGVTLRVEASHAVVDLERVRGVDLAIRYSPRGSTAGELLALECFRAFAAPSVAIKGRGGIWPPLLVSRWQSSDLDDIPLRPFEAAFGQPRERSPVIFDDEHHAALAAVSGSGIVILSDVLGQDMVASGLLAELSPDVSLPGHCYRLQTAGRSAAGKDVGRVIQWLLDETRCCRS
jgi:LysR family glycine cleavage system transcriptional activator